MKNSKFYKPPTLKERLTNLKYGILFWKGRSKGMIYTRSIKLDDLRYIFFPKDFNEEYGYLGSVPYNEDGPYFKALLPLVLAMDYEGRHKLCPKWFLRFLEVFSFSMVVTASGRGAYSWVSLPSGFSQNCWTSSSSYSLVVL
jgi:hypothetical protein